MMNPRAGRDDIDDGIDRADLVEVDLFDGDVVDFGFGGAEEFEGLDGGLFYSGFQVCGLDEGSNDGERAAVGVFVLVCVGVIVGVIVGVAGFVLVLGFGQVLVGVRLLMSMVGGFVFVGMGVGLLG